MKGSSRLAALAVVVALAVVFAGFALSSGGARRAYADGDATATAFCNGDNAATGDLNIDTALGDAWAETHTNDGGAALTDNDGSGLSVVQGYGTGLCGNGGIATATGHAQGDDGSPAFGAALADAIGGAQSGPSQAYATASGTTDSFDVNDTAPCDDIVLIGDCTANANASSFADTGGFTQTASTAFASALLGYAGTANADSIGVSSGDDSLAVAASTATGIGRDATAYSEATALDPDTADADSTASAFCKGPALVPGLREGVLNVSGICEADAVSTAVNEGDATSTSTTNCLFCLNAISSSQSTASFGGADAKASARGCLRASGGQGSVQAQAGREAGK